MYIGECIKQTNITAIEVGRSNTGDIFDRDSDAGNESVAIYRPHSERDDNGRTRNATTCCEHDRVESIHGRRRLRHRDSEMRTNQ